MTNVNGIRLAPGGLELGGTFVPLLSGSIHYFRLARSAWTPSLRALRNLGARMVDVYIPWAVHERDRGEYDFGEREPRLDVHAFLELASRENLYAIIRPGPHINAELTGFGIPERVLWDERCQARSSRDNPVVLPMLPSSFPVPSYASRAFYNEATLWLASVARRLGDLVWPHGPIVLTQVDNEGTLYFRDSPYDQDYHPDAIEQYRNFLRGKLKKIAVLRARYGDDTLTFDTLDPPTGFDPTSSDSVARHVDWMEFQETLLPTALYRFRTVLDRNGLGHTIKFHNLPVAESACPLDPARLVRSIDFVALDYYHHATDESRREIARRTTALRARADANGFPAFSAEMAAGFAPYFPPLDETDNAFVAMTALAYGLQGMNLYMAVGRDRWIGGPIDAHGAPRASAVFWRRLFGAIERTKLWSLSPRTAVRIVVPRSHRRLTRATHLFGPVPPSAFALSGRPVQGGSLEKLGGAAPSPVLRAERFTNALESSLETLRISFGYADEDLLDESLAESRWTIVVCPGALAAKTVDRAARGIMGGAALSLGPLPPELDESFQANNKRVPVPPNARVPVYLPEARHELHSAVENAAKNLEIRPFLAEPSEIFVTVHADSAHKPRVLFVLNPTRSRHHAIIAVPGVRKVRDALEEHSHSVRHESVAIELAGRTVRMLELDPGS